MTLQKFLNLLALMIGVAGVLMVSKAVYVKPRDMLKATYHYSAISWPSDEIISNMVSKKVNVTISVITIVIAFIIQFVSLVFVDGQTPFVESRLRGILLTFALVTVVFLVLFHIHKGLYRKNEFEIKCLEAENYLERGLVKELGREQIRVTELRVKFEGLEAMVKEYFEITRESSEIPSDFIKRIAAKIGYKLPQNIALSKLNSELAE